MDMGLDRLQELVMNRKNWHAVIHGVERVGHDWVTELNWTDVEVGSFCAHFFWRVLIINGCWILSKAFSASIGVVIWLLSFNLLIWYITLIDLHILKNPCIPGINPTWSWCMRFLMMKGCCWMIRHRDSCPMEETNLIQGQRCGWITEFLCKKVLLKYKEIEKASDMGIRRGQKEYPPASLQLDVI